MSEQSPIKVFLAISFSQSDVHEVVAKAVSRSDGFVVLDWAEQHRPGRPLAQGVREQIESADLVIAHVSGAGPNVSVEIGMALASHKALLLLVRESTDVPHHVAGLAVLTKYRDLVELDARVTTFLQEFRSHGLKTPAVSVEMEAAPSPPDKLSLEAIPGQRNRRVFIGGDYDFPALLIELRNFVNGLGGWTAIFAHDFDIPRNRTRDDTLLLLHNCRYAVFDITSEGGQLVELEKAPGYGVEYLMVYNTLDHSARPKATSMLARRSEAKPYTDLAELTASVKRWLDERHPP